MNSCFCCSTGAIFVFMRLLVELHFVSSGVEKESGSWKHPLYVLSLLPYSDSNGKYGWDKGLELLPAARVAVRHINSRTDILPGYELVLVERASDACGRPVTTKILQNFVGNVLKPYSDDDISNNNPIAVAGLACSTGTSAVSAIAGRYDILQLVMANSVLLRDNVRFPHLWRFISSSDDLVNAAVKLMRRRGWSKVGMISDGTGFFFQGMATTFRNLIKANNMTLVYDEAVDPTPTTIQSALNLIHNSKVRVIFAPTSAPEAQEIMCQAAQRDLVWPGYIWIFPSRQLKDFKDYFSKCESKYSMMDAVENITLVDFELSERDDNVTMVSGLTYAQYRSDYDDEYSIVQREYNGTGVEFSSSYNVYANPMYDELWALALALNSSLSELEINDLDITSYHYGMPKVTNIIEDHLRNISFSGALTNVYFNEHNEVPTGVNIFQVRRQASVHIAHYKNGVLSVSDNEVGDIPGDEFERKYRFVNHVIVIEVYINGIILFALTTLLLIASLLLRKEPELLAFSPLLSILIFLGCYLLQFASILSITQNAFAFSSSIYVAICYIMSWTAQSGIYLVATTVLIRLVRIYRIFTHFGKTSKLWRDQYLFFIIIIISCTPDCISIMGFIIDPLHVHNEEEYLLHQNPPIIQVTPGCSSNKGFSTVSYIIDQVYTMMLIVLLLVFAILTRKVNNKNFKDTKKITVFVFLFVLVTTISSILYFVFSSNDQNLSLVLSAYSYQVIAVLPLLSFIAPKTIPAFYYKVYKKEKRTFRSKTQTNATLTAFVRSVSANRT